MQLQQTFGVPLPEVGAILNAFPGAPASYKRRELKEGELPGLSHALVQAILEHTSTNTLPEAVEHLEREAQLRPDDPEAFLELSIVYGLIGDWEKATVAGEKTLDLYSKQGEGKKVMVFIVAALFILGFAYAATGSLREEGEDARRIARAEQSFQEAIKLNKDDTDAHYYLGALYRELGRWEEAETYLKRAVGIDPGYSKAYIDLGWIYERRNQPREALNAYEKAVQADPTNTTALRNLGQAHISLRHWDKAQEVLEQRIQLNPDDADAYDKLSALYFKLDDLEKAEEAAKRALELDPQNASTYFNLGMVYFERGDLTGAQREFRKTLSIDSGSALAEAARDNLRIIAAALHSQREEQKEKEGSSENRPVPGYEHVVLDKDGVPQIAGVNMKVIELVNEKDAYGWSPEQMLLEHPYLTLGQIHSALAYYADHEEDLDEDIQRRLDKVEEIREAMGPSPLRARLEAEGLL
jgi:tetratricopeptide (TPR) repeat protein